MSADQNPEEASPIGIKIGGIDKEAVDTLADKIIAVATCSPFPKVCALALETLRHMGKTENISLHGTSVDIGRAPSVPVMPSTWLTAAERDLRDEVSR